MIELSPKEYWKKLNYHDGMLYLSLLTIDGKDGWRMVEDAFEYNYVMITDEMVWCKSDVDEFPLLLDNEYLVIPIRGLKNES
jgi:hypothetical protein